MAASFFPGWSATDKPCRARSCFTATSSGRSSWGPSDAQETYALEPARHARLVFAVGVAELALEIRLLGQDHAALQDRQHRDQQQKHPHAGEHDGETEIGEHEADIDRVPGEEVGS